MGGEWTEKKLGELFKVKHGFAFKGEYFTDVETPYLLTTPGNFSIGGGFQNEKPKYYNGPVPHDYVLNAGSVIVTMTDLSKASDTLGNAAIVPDDPNVWLHNQRIGLLEFNDLTQSNPKFISYLLRSHEYRSWIVGSATGTTVKHTSPSRIAEFACPIPPLPEQKAIAHILGSLDDKIALNRRMNGTLERMAQALFKSWFVDFDPVIDNALVAGNPLPDELGFDTLSQGAEWAERVEARRQALATGRANRQAAQAFPATFQFTEELGWIPDGWEVRKLADFSDIKHGFAFKGKYFCDEKTENILVTPGNFNIGGGFKDSKLKYYNGPVDDNYVLNGQDLIVTMTDLSKAGDTLGYSAFVPKNNNFRYLHNQRIGRVLIKDARVGKFFLNQVFRSTDYRNEILGSISGSTVNHTSPSKILVFTLPFSGGKLESKIDSQCEALESKISQNNDEDRTLTNLRDTLLPKLISGELRIPDAEKLAEEALA